MSIYDVLGTFQADIDGFESARLIDDLCKRCKVLSLNVANDTVSVSLPFYQEKYLAKMCEDSNSVMAVRSRKGLYYFVSRYLKRYGIAIGILLFVIFGFLLSNTVLKIRVIGAQTPEFEQIVRETVAAAGIKPGKFIPSIDFADVELTLFKSSPYIAWTSIGHSGSVVTVNVSLATLKVNTDEGRIPCNILASRDGRIVSADVLAGEFTTLIGNAVRKGEMLVSGIVYNKNGGAYYYHSIAKIIAEFDETVCFEQELFDTVETTGETVTKSYLSFFDFDIPIPSRGKPSQNAVITSSSTGLNFFGVSLPMSVKKVSYTEVITKNKIYSQDDAEKVLMDKLAAYESNLLCDYEIVSREVETNLENDCLKLTARYTLRGDIGRESPIFVERKLANNNTKR